MADTIELLKEDVGDGLRDIQFREKAGRVSPMLLDQAVQAQLEGLGVEVYVLGVEAGLPGAINDFRVTWQPHAGGQPEHQWFDVNPPNGDWYVERWKLDGTVCATAWRCSLENAVDLARRAFRRGEVVRFTHRPYGDPVSTGDPARGGEGDARPLACAGTGLSGVAADLVRLSALQR